MRKSSFAFTLPGGICDGDELAFQGFDVNKGSGGQDVGRRK